MDIRDSSVPDFGYAGRISEQAFWISTGVLFGFVILSFLFRLYIKAFIQRQLSADDGFILIGVILLCTVTALFYRARRGMYLAEALLMNDHQVPINAETVGELLEFQRILRIGIPVQWCAITTVKLSFLALFKKLVKGLRPMIRFWWAVLVYTIIVWACGLTFSFVTCENGSTVGGLMQCVSKNEIEQMMRFIFAQLTLDIIGDMLIAAIPFWIIWQVRIRWTQKVSLFSSLCLSILLVAVTATRASGLVYQNIVDVVWNVFWLQISTEVGLILTITTTFRAFYVSRQHQAEGRRGRYCSQEAWYHGVQHRTSTFYSTLRSALRSKRQPDETRAESVQTIERASPTSDPWSRDDEHQLFDLPKPRKAELPGSRTFVKHEDEARVRVAVV